MFTKTETLRRLRIAARMIRDHEGLAPNTRAEVGTRCVPMYFEWKPGPCTTPSNSGTR